jgi:LuxR family maltose regulon positive regulatory protein
MLVNTIMLEPSKSPTLTRPDLILEKISIPSPLAVISRPRLIRLLTRSLHSCNATILSGRAGTGKTALAIDFAEGSGRAVAWYKVDAPDSKLSIFLHYLVASVRTQRTGFGNTRLLNHIDQYLASQLVSTLADEFVHEFEANAGEPLLIVIEDLHLVCDSEWLVPFLQRLLPLLPSDVHMLITSRTMPPAPLWRMRSKQTLSVIDEDLLSFSREEAIRLFETLGLTAEQALAGIEHSYGRAALIANLAATLRFAENQTIAFESKQRLRVG